MRLFIAGVYTSNYHLGSTLDSRLAPNERFLRDSVENFLESYHYINKQLVVDRLRKDGVRVFLDSGAFSAYTLGKEIDLGRYCDYILRNADIIEMASVLDAIGDPEGTLRNQHAMEARGVRPLPCFHYGEPESLLQHYIERYEYITLGGMVPISTPQLKLWLDRIFSEYICDADGVPKVKVHGFGLTSLPLMERYPWYSVDSSTWVQWGANGMILLPGYGQVNISDRSAARKQDLQHIDTLTPLERERLWSMIASYGVDPDRIRTHYPTRWAWNMWAFPKWMEHKVYGQERFKLAQPGLFS